MHLKSVPQDKDQSSGYHHESLHKDHTPPPAWGLAVAYTGCPFTSGGSQEQRTHFPWVLSQQLPASASQGESG